MFKWIRRRFTKVDPVDPFPTNTIIFNRNMLRVIHTCDHYLNSGMVGEQGSVFIPMSQLRMMRDTLDKIRVTTPIEETMK